MNKIVLIVFANWFLLFTKAKALRLPYALSRAYGSCPLSFAPAVRLWLSDKLTTNIINQQIQTKLICMFFNTNLCFLLSCLE